MDVQELCDLKATVDEILESLDPKEVGGAVNWGDLSCRQARWCLDDEGAEYPQILIEEASPAAVELHVAVNNGLRQRDIHWNPEILTEW